MDATMDSFSFLSFFLEMVSSCNSGWPESLYVDQAGLELGLLWNTGIRGMHHHTRLLLSYSVGDVRCKLRSHACTASTSPPRLLPQPNPV